MDIANGILKFIDSASIWILFMIMYLVGVRSKLEWTTSIRSVVTLVVVFAFVDMALNSKINAKDFIIIAQAVVNFYFLVKSRNSNNNESNDK